jgi:protein TonB
MSAGTVASGPALAPLAGQAAASDPGSGAGAMDGPESRAVDERAVDIAARLVPGGAPAYPPAALEAEIEADVPLEIVVDARGQVISARGLTHAGYGLDEAALRAIRGYRFIPARRGGQAVAVRMRWTVQFRLR